MTDPVTATVGPVTDDQRRVVLTAHPLQRVGAYALAALAGARTPAEVTPEAFDAAVARMADDAVRAALVESTKAPDGFWLKASGSFFPNSKMNHPSRGKRDRDELAAEVRRWRTSPALATRPGVPCTLCGRTAVGFYGKVDVPLAASAAHRNTNPPGHGGLALCWPCVACFHALPYGCQLTGGPSAALHSWDEDFLRRSVVRRVHYNEQRLALGQSPPPAGPYAREVEALRQLRDYDNRLVDGVELLVFSNDNREAVLRAHPLGQPLTEWLRTTLRDPRRRRGFGALVRVHRGGDVPGVARLARYAFHSPPRILATVYDRLVDQAGRAGALPQAVADLAPLCFSFAREVMGVRQHDIDQVQALARHVALVLAAENDAGKLKQYRIAHRDRRLRGWLERQAVAWALSPPAGVDAPFVTAAQFRLLFEPGGDGWFHQQLLLIAVLEELHAMKWRPADASDASLELADDQLGDEEPDIDKLDASFVGAERT